MEIPVLNRIGDFKAGITSLQNPSFLSQVLKIHQAFSFWKWGALILALVASFTTIITKIKILFSRIRNSYIISTSTPLLNQDYDSDSDVSCSSSSSLSNIDDDYENEEDEKDHDFTSNNVLHSLSNVNEFRVKGSGLSYYINNGNSLRRRRNSSFEDILNCWSDFKNGKNVVKLWDNLGFGFGLNLENNSRNGFSLYDMNKEINLFNIFGEHSNIPAVSMSSSSPAVVVSAENNLLKVWDTRVGSRIPEILAEWRPRLGKFVGIRGGGDGGVEKVYVRDDVTGRLTVGDIRKGKALEVNATENDVDEWWDADDVSGEFDSVLRRG